MKRHYDPDDIMQIHFILSKPAPDLPTEVKAWTDDKGLLEFYMEFHNCKKFKVKTLMKDAKDMDKILNECYHDEIAIYNATMRDNSSKHNYFENVPIPMTRAEVNVINSESRDLLAGQIKYNLMLELFPFMKNKYRKALLHLLMPQISELVVLNHDPMRIQDNLMIDEAVLLIRSHPNDFDS